MSSSVWRGVAQECMNALPEWLGDELRQRCLSFVEITGSPQCFLSPPNPGTLPVVVPQFDPPTKKNGTRFFTSMRIVEPPGLAVPGAVRCGKKGWRCRCTGAPCQHSVWARACHALPEIACQIPGAARACLAGLA
eukprot:gene14124-biopygen20083